MDATTFAVMRLAEHRFADLERDNRHRRAHAERRAALAERRAADAAEAPARNAATDLALAGPSS
ncbi:hypothetical protein HF576_09795 [Microbacterium sp. CFH 90308]|uniref:Uncharacterized protein n=1 Tax=Microbacterium salsuginis TaxID=2722803 RepID=A0ABX1KDJ3_9MICO|nr:hypothetical protein [Microbacterium sp. CFH 90308]NLP84144.1 hypothetical protein [Microbacterium sp. CFH 90308]